MANTDQQKKYVEWFFHHGLNEMEKSPSWLRASVGNQKFYFSHCFVEDKAGDASKASNKASYKLVLGYAMVKGQLQARAWYYSGSEATWRAFTGWRTNGAWTKGAEFETGTEHLYTIMGYVFECFTTVEMNAALQDFYEKTQPSAFYKKLFPWALRVRDKICWVVPPNARDPDRKLFDYMIGPYKTEAETFAVSSGTAKSKPSEIGAAFNNKDTRSFCLANLPAITAEAEALTKTTSSVKIQQGYAVNAERTQRVGPGHTLKKETALNAWLISCLGNQLPGPITYHHPVLDKPYVVRTYLLKACPNAGVANSDLMIEIAATVDHCMHSYHDWTNIAQTLQTPICWIRDVYYADSPVNSFGSRQKIPINLAFLVQKPCDYGSQISAYYLNRISSTGNEIAGKYAVLSLLNEATSPLLKNFKDISHYPRFQHKYHAKNIILEGKLEELRGLIIAGIFEYADIRLGDNKGNYDVKGYHGDSGASRADQLLQKISLCETLSGLNQLMYDCFVNNHVGTFSGGWFSQIRTNPTSLFTCVCRKLLSQFVADVPPPPMGAGNDKKLRYGGYQGSQGCLNRIAYYIQHTPPPAGLSREQFITNESANILKAFKG